MANETIERSDEEWESMWYTEEVTEAVNEAIAQDEFEKDAEETALSNSGDEEFDTAIELATRQCIKPKVVPVILPLSDTTGKLEQKEAIQLGKTFEKVGWDSINERAKPYFFKQKKKDVAFISLDMSQTPYKSPYTVSKKEEGKPNTTYYYHYLSNVEIYRNISLDGSEDIDISDNLLFQFGEGTARKLKPFFLKCNYGRRLYLIYRESERTSRVVEIKSEDFDRVTRISREDILSTFFAG